MNGTLACDDDDHRFKMRVRELEEKGGVVVLMDGLDIEGKPRVRIRIIDAHLVRTFQGVARGKIEALQLATRHRNTHFNNTLN